MPASTIFLAPLPMLVRLVAGIRQIPPASGHLFHSALRLDVAEL